jgi:hypothetical protein
MTEIKTNRWGVCDNTSHIEVKASAAAKTSLKQKKCRKKQQTQKGKRSKKRKLQMHYNKNVSYPFGTPAV